MTRAEEVLVFAPTGRDAILTTTVLREAGFACRCIKDVQDLIFRLGEGAGAAILAEEAVRPNGLEAIESWLAAQPPWSDFPLIILTSGSGATRRSLKSVDRLIALGNVTLLERPVRIVTMVTAVRSALRARQRQYETQSYIEERVRAEEVLTRQAQLLAQSNVDLQQFAYVTSHDLQEPVRTIHAHSQLLRRRYEGKLDAAADQILGFITAGAIRMQELIRDLLAYSRVVNLEDRPFGPVPMDRVVAWCLQNLQIAISENNAVVTYSNLPLVWGDHSKLVQLLQNLISNAIKYRRASIPPLISIEAEQKGDDWLFRVSDNGQGIDPEYSERIFGLFKRLHGKSVPGTGLGLAICRKILEQHEGRIWVERKREPGAVFCFTLKKIPTAVQAPHPADHDG